MRLTKATMDEIGRKHRIHPRYRREFLKLANRGILDNDEFGRRLFARRNYKHAEADIMRLLSSFSRRTQCSTTS